MRLTCCSRDLRVWAGLLALATVGGCGPSYEFAEVQGKVTLNQKPLEGVVVRFYPLHEQGMKQRPYATGVADGPRAEFELVSQEGEPGALVGPNKVVINWPSRDMRDPKDTRLQERIDKIAIPLRYTSVTTTPLLVEVKSGEGQTINLDLIDDE